ncbi:hypothetical protein BDY21DRAFT_192664 [Lineolata rhizophorae]|uniref:TPR-like protein n=1 Tax=Lineolata rhizophorae TaxID=578093 RepID=A0A6A6P6E8_9PEZI|nr:hypothetical protein BDY21DRAFT_192664 [Lineolata rhizophorae]
MAHDDGNQWSTMEQRVGQDGSTLSFTGPYPAIYGSTSYDHIEDAHIRALPSFGSGGASDSLNRSIYPDLPSESDSDSDEDGFDLPDMEDEQDDEDFEQDHEQDIVMDDPVSDDPDYTLLDPELEESDEEFSPSDEEPTGDGRRGARRGGRGRGRARARAIHVRPRKPFPRGEGPIGSKKGKRGPQAAADPNPNFKRLHSLATNAFINGNFDEAVGHARQAVQENPEIFAAHGLLSEILLAAGNKAEGLESLTYGAHTKRDPGLWWHIATETLELDDLDKNEKLRKADYCYRQALKLDKHNFDARMERFKMNLELGRFGSARTQCERMLKLRADDQEVLRLYTELCVKTGDSAKAIALYDQRIDMLIDSEYTGNERMDWSLLNVYLDLLIHSGRFDTGVRQLSTLSRWMLGRKGDTLWDAVNDDREWDVNDERRIKTEGFEPNRYPNQAYGAGLPIEIRVKLGVLRIRMRPSYYPEAMRHFELLNPSAESSHSHALEYQDLFREAADALRESGFYEDALRYYSPLQKFGPHTSIFYLSLLECHSLLGNISEARALFDNVLQHENGNVKARVLMAKMYQKADMSESGLSIIRDLIRIGKRDVVRKEGLAVGQDGWMLRSTYRRRRYGPRGPYGPRKTKLVDGTQPSKAGTIRMALDFPSQDLWKRLKSLKDVDKDEDDETAAEYIGLTQKLVAEFCENRQFFPRDRSARTSAFARFVDTIDYEDDDGANGDANADNGDISRISEAAIENPEHTSHEEGTAANSLQLDSEDFQGVSFETLLDAICESAWRLAKAGRASECWEMLMNVAQSLVFDRSPQLSFRLRITILACGILLDDDDQVLNTSRWFIRRFSHSPDSFRLYTSAIRHNLAESSKINLGPSQKFILRHLKAADFAVLNSEQRNMFEFTSIERSSWTNRGTTDGNPSKLKELDPTVIVCYGHILAHSGAYPSALNYYFRAFALTPDDPVLNLSIATAFVQHGLRRQSENRQFQIQQGLAFLRRYYEIRTKDNVPIHVQEAEFNVGRMWHLLGLVHQAIPAYKKCIMIGPRAAADSLGDLPEESEESEDFAAEAAYALQFIFCMGGDTETARQLTERWLVL